jgi:hypothetical protein
MWILLINRMFIIVRENEPAFICRSGFIRSLFKLVYLSNELNISYTSRKPVLCIGKLLKIKSKLILISFTYFVDFFFNSKCCRQDR